ncbi:hypothetical protein AB0K51_13355 [Kitasatospora sp. NPDC049285]|uniref:hypothetical protein n=1 Tax=Kitasatospora sp. NPDC049285 TaxID=3157096 RepID=UPI0034342A31
MPLIHQPDEGLAIPAEQVTHLLRELGLQGVRRAPSMDSDPDPRTAGALAAMLGEVSDQIDVECIAFVSDPDGPRPGR